MPAAYGRPMDPDGLPAGWSVWDHVPEDRLILAFRPDVFDGSTLPPACLPTIYVREGERDPRRPGRRPAPGTEGRWTVTLFLEPDVRARLGERDTWEGARSLAVDRAGAFVAGEIAIEELYQLPHEEYLEAIRALIETP